MNVARINYARAGLARNLLRVKSYYNTRAFAVKSNHLLCKIINTAAVDVETPIHRFYQILDAKADKTGMHFKLTSPIYSGIAHDGIFYGPGTKEVIVANNQYFDPDTAIRNWQDLEPVQVVSHARTELDLYLPRGKDNSTDKGTAVISINIPLLMCMWRGWVTDQVTMMKITGTSPAPITEFVHRWVLPGMLRTHLDQCLVNRTCRIANSAPMGMGLAKQAFYLLDYTSQLDEVVRDVVEDRFKSHRRPFKAFLASVPGVSSQSAQSSCKLPFLAPTRQYRWIETVARLKLFHAWVKTQGIHAVNADRNTVNDFLNEFHRLSTGGTIGMVFACDVDGEILNMLEDVYSITGTKMPGNFMRS